MKVFLALHGENAHVVEAFEGAHAGGAYGDGFTPVSNELLDGLTAHGNVLRVHVVPTYLLALDGLEGACTHMKGQFLTVNACLIKGVKHPFCEMKPCGGSGYRTFNLGIDGLIGRLVALLSLTIQIRGNGQFAHSIKEFCPRVVAIP